ncbi:hypothetical protein imdm_2306 [gamma proteobacterium IMCC2047]|nr:hypothetical protein imdm_2306 [gamma proteobacterium IMCC2047]
MVARLVITKFSRCTKPINNLKSREGKLFSSLPYQGIKHSFLVSKNFLR